MKGLYESLIDFDDFSELETISETNHARITLAARKSIPDKKYIIKTFNFKCKNPKHQKIIAETFYQIQNSKKQYISYFKQFSYSSFKPSFEPSFLMKYISSDTLEQVFKWPDFLTNWTIKDAMNCLFAIAESLSFFHQHLIYHGNLCPSNIIIDKAKQSYICDFGLYPIKKLYISANEMCNKDYKDPSMKNNLPTSKNDIYSYGVLICQFFLIFSGQQQQQKEGILKEFVASKDPDKYDLFPEIFQEIIPKCLDQSKNIDNTISFKEIIEIFQDESYVIEKNRIKISDLYKNYINTSYIETLAKMDDPEALCVLGKMYETEYHDDEKALYYYEKSANLNNSTAQNDYGVLLQKCNMNNASMKKLGAEYQKKSADQGNVLGIANYGLCLYKGIGVRRNIVEAEKYLKKAADLGDSESQCIYDFSLINNKSSYKRKNEGLLYIKNAINNNNDNAYYLYGNLLSKGKVVKKDDELAMEYFKIAADMGNHKAMFEYANGNLQGIGVSKNYEIAIEFYKKAAKKGYEKAINKLESLNEQMSQTDEEGKDNDNDDPSTNKSIFSNEDTHSSSPKSSPDRIKKETSSTKQKQVEIKNHIQLNDGYIIENPILTIPVEPEKENLKMIEVAPLDTKRLIRMYGKYISTSMKQGKKIIFRYRNHPVLEGFIDAYKKHRSVTISPDIIWILIIQAFSNHVGAKSEELRSMFVNFDGKQELLVDRSDLNINEMTYEDFQKLIFPEMIEKISGFTGKSIIDTMTPNFTTTTPVSLAVGQLSIMSAFKNYFTYRIHLGGCGFPHVTIEGTIKDWEKIMAKLSELKKYKFGKFTKKIAHIIQKIIDTKKGNVDTMFWKQMMRIKKTDGTYSPDFIEGWITSFFPYDFYGKEINGPIYENTVLPSEMLSIPFILKIIPYGMDEKDVGEIQCEMLAGFVGLTQDEKTASLKPEIGWLIRQKKIDSETNDSRYQREQVSSNMIRF